MNFSQQDFISAKRIIDSTVEALITAETRSDNGNTDVLLSAVNTVIQNCTSMGLITKGAAHITDRSLVVKVGVGTHKCEVTFILPRILYY